MARPKEYIGTGEELERLLKRQPKQFFRLTSLSAEEAKAGPGNAALLQAPGHNAGATLSPEEEERLLDELAALGKRLSPSSAAETYSRETIY